MTSDRMRAGWIVAVVIVTVLAVIVAVYVPRSGQTPPSPAPAGFATYIAPGQIFCLGDDTQNIVTSDASYESNLIGYSQSYPLADIDYLIGYGRSDHVCLPGTSADHYTFDGSVYVDGSGWVEEWTAPNGGRFAYLHLMSGIVGLTARAITPHAVTRIGQRDMTYLALSHLLHARPAPGAGTYSGGQRVRLWHEQDGHGGYWFAIFTVRNSRQCTWRFTWPRYHYYQITRPNQPCPPLGAAHTRAPGAGAYSGGQRVGWSGWPTSWEYSGGGPPGPGDAHLCLTTDALASDWFYRVANHLDYRPKPKPKPPAFNRTRWLEYRTAHHERPIWPRQHGRLIWSASVWRHHMSLRGVRYAGHYYGTARRGYTKWGFRCGSLFQWPAYHKSRVVKGRCTR